MSKYKNKPTWLLVLAFLFYMFILISVIGCNTKHHVITEDGVNWYSTEEYKDGYDTIEEPGYIE